MRRTGPDSLSSWMAVFYCSLISMLLYGVVRLSGVMFVASMDRFQVDRQSASFPYILCDFLQSMAGPVTGFLSLKFGAPQVMILGCFIASLGTAACFFAQNIETVTVLWGILYGLGFGLSSLLLPVIITQHFVKRRATAISLVYVGSYIGFSFMPSVADLLIQTYGLSGAYLFLSGFLLHCVPLSMLLRNPKTHEAKRNSVTERFRKTNISIIGEYPSCNVSDSKSSSDTQSLGDVQSNKPKNAFPQYEKNRKDSTTRVSKGLIQYQARDEDSNKKHKYLNCADLQSMGKSDTYKQYNQGIENKGFEYDNSSKYNLKIKSNSIENLKTEKATADVNQIREHTSIARSQSCFGISNQGFSKEDLANYKQSHQSTTELSKANTTFKCCKAQAECTNGFPRLIKLERIASSPSIFSNITLKTSCAEVFYNKDSENHEKYSNEFFPVFFNPGKPNGRSNNETYFEVPSKSDSKTYDKFHHSQKRRVSSTSKQEITISKGLKIFLEPIFLLVLFAYGVYGSSFIALITVIVDLTIDIGISASDGNFVIMAFSIASNIGLISFGWVTDCGYLSLTNFAALMFFLRTVTLCAIPFSPGLGMLISLVSLQGFFEASLANMFPLIVAEYYTDEIHQLAISSTLFFCGPMYLATPVLIGFFRDDLGSYVYLFFLMAALSLICGVLLLASHILAKWRCGRDDWILRKNE